MAKIASLDTSIDVEDGDTFKATVTPAGDPFGNIRPAGYDA